MLSRLPKPVKKFAQDWPGFGIAVVALLFVVAGLLAIRQGGGMERLELLIYDKMMRQLVKESPDPRILVVGITEADIREQRHWPLSDAVIAQLLANLQAHQPRAIGLDIYRDFAIEPGYADFVAQLQAPNVITIEAIAINTLEAIPPPPDAPPTQVGFNNLPLDPDGVIRRAFLYLPREEEVKEAFALQLAFLYLAEEGIEPIESPQHANVMQLGPAPFMPLTPYSGGYDRLDAGGYQMFLQYRGTDQAIEMISLGAVLRGEFDPALVRDRLVMIGSTAPSLLDRKATPYSATLGGDGKMAGVMIHAQIAAQILDVALGERSLLTYWPDWAEIAYLVAAALVSSFTAWRLRHPLLLIGSISVSVLGIVGGGFWLFQQGLWIPIAAPVISVLSTAGVVITYQSYDDYCRRRIVMQLLGQNTSPEIAEALWQGRDTLLKAGKLPGIRLTATILFLDIKGFSTVAEQMEPEALLDWLNDILGEITQEVLTREGIINKFTGDGLMAIFGVPLSRIHKAEIALDAQNAVYCALAISDRLTLVNQRNHAMGLPDIQMRIGIFTGPVVVGSLGGKDRLEYGVLGDTVNTASRLESCAKERQPTDCRILIATETLQHLGDRFHVESWGPMALKGKQQMADVFQVLSIASKTR